MGEQFFFSRTSLKLQYRGNNVYIEKASHHGMSWPDKLGEGNRVGGDKYVIDSFFKLTYFLLKVISL